MKIAVSACLLGENCKYNGGNNYNEKLKECLKGHEVIGVCPEVLGGLTIPRQPAEIVDGIVKRKDGSLVDEEFKKGAKMALDIVKKQEVELVVLQSRSPSCGVGEIYDGTFSKQLISGDGVFVKMLKENAIQVMDIADFTKKYFGE